jgi:hypothetical protein
MEMRLIGIGLLASLLVCAWSAAPTDEAASKTPGQMRATAAKPPAVDGDETMDILFAQSHIVSGAVYYYKVYGQWPLTWNEVVSAGLCQTELLTPAGLPVNPDDGSLDFQYDCTYKCDARQSNPAVAVSLDFKNGGTHSAEIPAPRSYAFTLSFIEPGSPGYEFVESYRSDPERLKQWAIVGMIWLGLRQYRDLHGDYPHDLQEFLQSGIGTVDAASINPVTNEVIKGDGSANDIVYEYVDIPDVMPTILPVDADGERCRIQINY